MSRIVGVPRETHRHEHRVGLSPFAVKRLVRRGHSVLVERLAGEAAHFRDADYEAAGARIVYTAEEAFKRADMVCRVGAVAADELDLLKPGSILCGFQNFAVTPRESVRRLMDLEVTLVAYEMILDAGGELAVLTPFSEMAGQMAVHLAAYYLQNESRGRAVLMGNVPGVPPPTVMILGAGTVGRTAARQALASGAHVIVLDADLRPLRELSESLNGQVVTVLASRARLAQYAAIADVLIGAIHTPGRRAPFLVTEAMVQTMKPGSVIIDVSIDQGGCVETSRPTTPDHPTYTVHDVVHYCVPNMTANVARTASRALVNAALPYITALADQQLESALAHDPGLAAGVALYRGKMVDERIGATLDIPATPLAQLLDEASSR